MKTNQIAISNIKHTVREVMRLIDQAGSKMSYVLDDNSNFYGLVTDGDIRRGILGSVGLDESVQKIMNSKPLIIKDGNDYADILEKAKSLNIDLIPVIDSNGKLVKTIVVDEAVNLITKDTPVVLMAGGLGMRLRPITENIPKPMVEVGGYPMLHYVIEGFKKSGFKKFIICVNYKAEIIESYFKDGSGYKVEIEYFHEKKRLGTAGALGFLKEKLNVPFFLMNADIITNVDFSQILEEHLRISSFATVGVRKYSHQVPFGVVHLDKNGYLVKIEEKPTYSQLVSTGIYVLSPKVLELVEKDNYLDMPDLLQKIYAKNEKVKALELNGYWLDVGRMSDLEKANVEIGNLSEEEGSSEKN